MIRLVRQSFAGGELAAELHMRSDLAAYQKGAELIRNMVVRRTGSVMKRAGSEAVSVGGEVVVGDGTVAFGAGKNVKMLPFFYDTELSYVLLVTNVVVRVVQVSPEFVIDRDFEWDGWADADVAAMRARQVGDTLFVSAPGKAVRRFVRDATSGAWTVEAEQVDGPPGYTLTAGDLAASLQAWDSYDAGKPAKNKNIYYQLWAESDTTGQRARLIAQKTVNITKIWEAGASVRFTVAKSKISAAAVGDTWILCKRSAGAFGRIGSYIIEAGDVGGGGSVDMFEDDNILPGERVDRQTNVRDGDDAGGYALVDFYQQRQVLCGNANAPWTLWFSRLAGLYTWLANRPTDDMDPFRATIPAMRASDIRHTVSGKRLLLFTSDGIYAAHSESEGFSWRTCKLEKVNPLGAGTAVPVDTGASVVFVADDDRTLVDMRYSFVEDAHTVIDRSVLARHLTRRAAIVSIAWQAYPDGVLWCVLDDGRVLSFTYLVEHEVFAWARHEICDSAGKVLAIVDMVATGSVLAKDGDKTGDATGVVVMLAQNESDGLMLLRMRQDAPAAGCVDSVRRAVAENEDESVTLTVPEGGVWRLAGEGWQEGDGEERVWKGPVVVESGWPIEAELCTLKPENPEMPTQALRRRVVECVIRTLQSGKYEVADARGGEFVEVSGSEGGIEASDVRMPPLSGWQSDGRLHIRSNGAERLEVLGVVTTVDFER